MKKVCFLSVVLFFMFTCFSKAQVSSNDYQPDGISDLSNDKAADHVLLNSAAFNSPAFFNVKKTATIFSGATDHFRSVQTGDWGAITTWETSPDGGITPWTAATLTPTSAANIIQIRNGHTVTVNTNENMDQVIIENGGLLLHIANTLTVNDGIGDDIIVQSGGIFTLASNSNGPQFSPVTATANINTGGMLRLSASGLTAAGTGVHASNYIYQNVSILEYTLNLIFSTDGVTFFPNANATTIPVFRITDNIGIVGALSTTTINGLFEANGNITFQNAGTKIFRNGIIGTGNVNGATSGKFIINGATASFGGSGLLTLPITDGMDIGTTTTITMLSNKSIIGNIALLSNALVILGTNNLTITGNINGGSATSHIVTNSTGKLEINNIAGATPRIFPIGANTTTINPLAIFNGDGLNYGARVEIGLNPGIAFPVSAVNRTWVVRPSATPAGTVNVNFFYINGDGNALFAYFPATVELGFNTGVWNVINTGLTQTGNFEVLGTVNTLFAANTDAPLVIANLGAILANSNSVLVDYFSGIKQNNDHVLNWKLTCSSSPFVNTELERSTDGRNYKSITGINATALRCQQPFSYTDAGPATGTNYYRLKMTDADGKVLYSTVVVLIHANNGFEFVNISPNPVVGGSFDLKVSTAKNTQLQIIITDMQGRVLQQRTVSTIAGFNSIPINVTKLAAGTYQIYGITAHERSKVLRFVVQ